MPITFDHEEEAYHAWLAAHPDGYLVNRRRRHDSSYLKLHRSTCPHVSRDPPGNFTTTAYLKVCSSELKESERWAREEFGAVLDLECHCNGR